MTDLIAFICLCITVYIVCKIAKHRGYTPDGVNHIRGSRSSGIGSGGGCGSSCGGGCGGGD